MPQLQGNTKLAQPNNSDVADATKQLENIAPANVNPLKEYISGGPLAYLQDYYRALPQYIDDITSDFGIDVYERMLKDSQVTSAFESLRMGVLSSGIDFPGRVQDEKDPDFEQSQEVRDFVERNLTQRLNQPFRQICYDLLEGMATGHKVAELVYEYATDTTDEDKGKVCLKAVKVKPQRATAFVVDAFYNVVALIGLMPGQGASAMAMQGIIGIPGGNVASPAVGQNMPNALLPREKFAVFTYRPQDADPRGTSILRPAYDPWWCKSQVKKDYLAYMSRFASPSLIGYTPEDSVAYPVSDGYANLTPDSITGIQGYLTPEQIMASSLASFKNGTYLVLPGGSKVEPLEATGNGEAFESAFEFYNTEITKGIQYQALATNEGQHQSRAASQTHENVKDMVIDFAKEALADCVNWDIIYNLVRYNYGEDVARRLAPKVSFAGASEHNFAEDAAGVAALMTAKFIHVSQYQGIDSQLNLPARDMEAQLADLAAEKQQQADQQQQQLEIAKAKIQQPQVQPGQANQPVNNQDKAKMSAEDSADFDHWVTVEGEHILIKGDGGASAESAKEGTTKGHNAIRITEGSLAGKSFETALAVKPTGEKVLTKTGGANSVEFTAREERAMQGAILTHNHPNSTSFSPEDVLFASHANLAEMRAVGQTKEHGSVRYVIKPGSGGWPSTDKIMESIKAAHQDVKTELQDKLNKKQLFHGDVSFGHNHAVLSKVSKQLGFSYKREFVNDFKDTEGRNYTPTSWKGVEFSESNKSTQEDDDLIKQVRVFLENLKAGKTVTLDAIPQPYKESK